MGGALLRVGEKVSLQAISTGKFGTADLALEWLLPGVGELMSLQVTGAGEPGLTYVALERLSSRVRAKVLL